MFYEGLLITGFSALWRNQKPYFSCKNQNVPYDSERLIYGVILVVLTELHSSHLFCFLMVLGVACMVNT